MLDRPLSRAMTAHTVTKIIPNLSDRLPQERLEKRKHVEIQSA
jgi:hypothetical protein